MTKLAILLYGDEELLRTFGRVDITDEELRIHIDELFEKWELNQLKITWNELNVKTIERIRKEFGRFNVISKFGLNQITIRFRNPEDLLLVKLRNIFD